MLDIRCWGILLLLDLSLCFYRLRSFLFHIITFDGLGRKQIIERIFLLHIIERLHIVDGALRGNEYGLFHLALVFWIFEFGQLDLHTFNVTVQSLLIFPLFSQFFQQELVLLLQVLILASINFEQPFEEIPLALADALHGIYSVQPRCRWRIQLIFASSHRTILCAVGETRVDLLFPWSPAPKFWWVALEQVILGPTLGQQRRGAASS